MHLSHTNILLAGHMSIDCIKFFPDVVGHFYSGFILSRVIIFVSFLDIPNCFVVITFLIL